MTYTYAEDITSGATYEFRVLARNKIGFGPYSDPIKIIAAIKPEAPTDLVKNRSKITSNQISFTWSPPTEDGGSPIIDYSVKMYNETSG